MNRMKTLLIVGVLLLSGCFGPVPPEENRWTDDPIYHPEYHLHNIWKEFEKDGDLRVHFTIVIREEAEEFIIDYSGELTLHESSDAPGDNRTTDYSELFPSLRMPGPLMLQESLLFEPRNLTLFSDPWYSFNLRFRASGAGATYVSGCYQPDGDQVVNRGRLEHCSGSYNPSPPYYDRIYDPFKNEKIWPLPHDPPYQELVWECCNLRSLPAYDAYENWTLNDTQELQDTKSFPVQKGAENATVTLQLSPPTDPVKRLLPNESMIRLTVYDANDTLVAEDRAQGANGMVEVQLEELPNRGVYHAEVEAEGAEGSLVEWVVHVNDGVHPPQRWWED